MTGLDGIETRAATSDDLPACERVWRDALNGYLVRLGQLAVPEYNPGLRRLHAHTLATDPERFRVATRRDRVVGFGSAVRRGPVWFLSMLFVDPAEQSRGLGRTLLGQLLSVDGLGESGGRRGNGEAGSAASELGPGTILATTTDSVQPISNGLYASLGIVPQMPLLSVVGRPRPGWTPPPLPGGITAGPLAAGGGAGAIGATGAIPSDVEAEIADLDREVVGFEHRQDHAFMGRERPAVFGYRDAARRLVGYGHTSEVGRVGPVAVRQAALLGPVLAHLLTTVEPRGASAIWLGGTAGPAIETVLEAGLRFEDFPLLVCWSQPFADFARYVPFSPGLP